MSAPVKKSRVYKSLSEVFAVITVVLGVLFILTILGMAPPVFSSAIIAIAIMMLASMGVFTFSTLKAYR